MAQNPTAAKVAGLIKEPIESLGLKLWDVKFLKEGTSWYLRVFIDSENGIGIVPHIYNEGTEYWGNRNQRDKGICARIEAQIKQAENAKVVVIHRQRQPKKNKREIDLSTIASMEDGE